MRLNRQPGQSGLERGAFRRRQGESRFPIRQFGETPRAFDERVFSRPFAESKPLFQIRDLFGEIASIGRFLGQLLGKASTFRGGCGESPFERYRAFALSFQLGGGLHSLAAGHLRSLHQIFHTFLKIFDPRHRDSDARSKTTGLGLEFVGARSCGAPGGRSPVALNKGVVKGELACGDCRLEFALLRREAHAFRALVAKFNAEVADIVFQPNDFGGLPTERDPKSSRSLFGERQLALYASLLDGMLGPQGVGVGDRLLRGERRPKARMRQRESRRAADTSGAAAAAAKAAARNPIAKNSACSIKTAQSHAHALPGIFAHGRARLHRRSSDAARRIRTDSRSRAG